MISNGEKGINWWRVMEEKSEMEQRAKKSALSVSISTLFLPQLYFS